MRTETIQIQLHGKATGAILQTYFMDASQELLNSTKRPAVLLMPGGAYRYTSDREAEPLAIRLNAMGFQVAVLRYSCAPTAYPQALLEAAAAFQLLKDNSIAWNIRQERIFLMGCSAGGHLAASLGINWNQPIITQYFQRQDLRPFGQILCYPVITAGAYAHEESIRNLLQEHAEDAQLRKHVSLELHVHKDVPRTFLWHTYTDPTVSVQNSLLFVSALIRQGILCEFHMYDKGAHGLSTADRLSQRSDGEKLQPECAGWMTLLETWMNAIL